MLWLSVFLFLIGIYIHYAWKEYCYKWEKYYNIPRPSVKNYLANAFTFFKSPEEKFKRQRKEALQYFPIYRPYSITTSKIVYLFHPEDLKIFFSNSHQQQKICELLPGIVGQSVLMAEGAAYYYRKKLLSPIFNSDSLKSYLRRFNKDTEDYLANNLGQDYGGIDVLEFVNVFFKHAIFGEKTEISDYQLVQYVKLISGKRINKTLQIFIDILDKHINERTRRLSNRNVKEDTEVCAIDNLIVEKFNGAHISDKGIRNEILTLLASGPAFTSKAVQFTLLCLANHQNIQTKVFGELVSILGEDLKRFPTYDDLKKMTYMEQCINESLRLFPPVINIRRQLLHDMETSTGHTIPGSTVVIIRVFDIHHLPDFYVDPEKYDPERFSAENSEGRHSCAFIPFGAGPRSCLGRKLAFMVIKSILCAVMMKYILKPVDTLDSVVLLPGLTLETKHEIKVKFVKRF